MSDLEEKGYLFHPHTSAGRVPTDLAYRVYVDHFIEPAVLTSEERDRLAHELDVGGSSAVERLVRRTTRALSLLSRSWASRWRRGLDTAVLEKLDLLQVATNKVLLVATIRSGIVRTVYVDLPFGGPSDTLLTLTVVLNERLAGLTLREIRETLSERLSGAAPEG
jgi:heat-inducible transcriptional repressor